MVLPGAAGYPVTMADLFDVIADSTRRELLQVLLEHSTASHASRGEISVGDIVEALGVSQPTVSKHLKVLREHGLVHAREEGQHRYYRLDPAPLEEVEDWLIPFLGSGSSGSDSAVLAAWAGTEVASKVGRRTAEGVHQARAVIHDAQEQVTRAAERLPWVKRKEP